MLNNKNVRRHFRQTNMDESLPPKDWELSHRDEIAALIATAILRKQQRKQNKEPGRLDNSATSCMTVSCLEETPEKKNEVAYERG